MTTAPLVALLALLALAGLAHAGEPDDPPKLGEDHFADSDGVRIHYVAAGDDDADAPLVVLLHGFPDFWYTWRAQLPALAEHARVVAVDLRGYNRSGQPEGVAGYALEKLVADVAAVVEDCRREKATIVGHDWGGMIAWTFAMTRPEMCERLVILNLPHPKGLLRELRDNPEQQQNSQYARDLQRPEAAAALTPELLAAWVKDPEARRLYVDAFRRSSIPGMLAYYRANYPRPPYDDRPFPPVRCPVLMIHGLKDEYLLPGALDGTWNWVEADLTLVTVPDAGHFVQQDAADFVTRTIVRWLTR